MYLPGLVNFSLPRQARLARSSASYAHAAKRNPSQKRGEIEQWAGLVRHRGPDPCRFTIKPGWVGSWVGSKVVWQVWDVVFFFLVI